MGLSERWEVEVCDECGRIVNDPEHATSSHQNGPTHWVEVVPVSGVGHCPQCGCDLADDGPCPTPGCLTFPWRVHALGLEEEVERLRSGAVAPGVTERIAGLIGRARKAEEERDALQRGTRSRLAGALPKLCVRRRGLDEYEELAREHDALQREVVRLEQEAAYQRKSAERGDAEIDKLRRLLRNAYRIVGNDKLAREIEEALGDA